MDEASDAELSPDLMLLLLVTRVMDLQLLGIPNSGQEVNAFSTVNSSVLAR